VLYDLGCGDGQIVVMAAKRFDIRGVGIDIDPRRIARARANARRSGVQHLVRFCKQDVCTADLSEATVVTLYLTLSGISAIAQKLRAELLRERASYRGMPLFLDGAAPIEWNGFRFLRASRQNSVFGASLCSLRCTLPALSLPPNGKTTARLLTDAILQGFEAYAKVAIYLGCTMCVRAGHVGTIFGDATFFSFSRGAKGHPRGGISHYVRIFWPWREAREVHARRLRAPALAARDGRTPR
jgi:SAM-dependent methyltransferase